MSSLFMGWLRIVCAIVGTGLVVGAASADTVTVAPRGEGPFSITVDQAIATGHTVEGRAYVVIPPEGATVTASTPGMKTDPVRRNGLQLNSQVNTAHGYDARDERGFDPAQTATLPRAVRPGDILILTHSRPAGEMSRKDRRAGLFRQGTGSTAIWFTDTRPDTARGAPAPIGWPGRGTPQQPPAFDARAAAAALPRHPVARMSRHVPPVAEVIAAIDQEAFLLAQRPATVAGTGYEALLPQGYGGTRPSNYGRYVASAWGAAGLLLISDRLSVDQKAQLLQRAFTTGHDWYESLKGAGKVIGGNGGHHQFHFIPVLIYLHYSGQDPADMATYMPGNLLSQPFYVSADQIADLRRHDRKTAPFTYRERRVEAADGNVLTLSKTRSDAAQTGFTGLVLTNGKDRSEVIGGRRYAVELDNPHGFAPGQTVWFESPYPIQAGDVNWVIRERDLPAPKGWNTFNPSPRAYYRNLNYWSEALLFGHALIGPDWPKAFNAFRDYVITANAPDLPAGYDFPGHLQKFNGYGFAEAFWTLHWVNIIGPRVRP